MSKQNHSRALAARLFAAGTVLASAGNALANVHYVDVTSTNATQPYTNWVTAATNIQDAVDAAVAGDEIVVTNGIYATGGRAIDGTTTNRVAVDKPLTLRSVNGPQFTTIQGYQVPGTTNGDGAVRCVYLTNGASLSGFTLTHGATRAVYDDGDSSGGGLWCELANTVVVSNCVVAGNSAFYNGGGSHGGTLNNCTLTGNSACQDGGGAYLSTLNNCILTGNSASYSGGGASSGTLNNCTLTGNSAWSDGGGAYGCTLNNCVLWFNSAIQGANYDSYSLLNRCCTTPHPISGFGNSSSDPQLASTWRLSAVSPCRAAGNASDASGTDIDGEAWASPPSIGCDEYHASALMEPLSVRISASFTNVAIGFPVQFTALIEGRTTANTWNFGDGIAATNQPYISHPYAAPGDYAVVLRVYTESQSVGTGATMVVHVVPEIHYVAVGTASPAPPYLSWATAATNIQDAVDAATVPGALVLVTNGIYAAGGRAVSGTTNRVAVDKPLTLRSVNGPQLTVIDGGGSVRVRCVFLTDRASLSGFTLTNGFCGSGGGAYGGTLNNCVLSGNLAQGRPFGGSGGGAAGCTLNHCTLSRNTASGIGAHVVYGFGSGGGAVTCTLNDCTLEWNWASGGENPGYGTEVTGGGVNNCTLNNCTLNSNSASLYFAVGFVAGGGAIHSTLNNCTLTGNAGGYGGGAFGGTLNNCSLSGNSGDSAGGVSYSRLNNCILYSNINTANQGTNDNYDSNSTLNYSCTTPLPTNGFGNITNAPLFVGQANGNLRLQSNSPCINAGMNAFAPAGTDVDGSPRIKGGTVDLGAYEFQLPTSLISYAWLQQFGLPTNGSADTADPDGDGLMNWQEWRCGTDPTNAVSALRLLAPASGGSGLVVRWESVADRTYFLERSTTASSGFTTLATGIPGQPGATTYTDTNAFGAGPWFYRVGVTTP